MPYFLVISGSPNKFSKTAILLRTIAKHLEAQELEVRAVHVADLEHSFTDHLVQVYLDDFDLLAGRAAAIVLLTPVGNGNQPGVFAPLLDLLPNGALAGTPVLLVAIGGLPEHVTELEQGSIAEFRRLRANLLQPSLHIASRDWIIVGDNPPKLTRRTEHRLADALREAESLGKSNGLLPQHGVQLLRA